MSRARFIVPVLAVLLGGAVAARQPPERAPSAPTPGELREQLAARAPLRDVEPPQGVAVKSKGASSYPTSFEEWVYRAEGATTPARLVDYYRMRVAGDGCVLPAPTVEGGVAVTFGRLRRGERGPTRPPGGVPRRRAGGHHPAVRTGHADRRLTRRPGP